MQTLKRTPELYAPATRFPAPAPASVLTKYSMSCRLDMVLYWCQKKSLCYLRVHVSSKHLASKYDELVLSA